MDPHISWLDILLRVVCTIAAGAVIGLNREEHGRAAGLRTTVLICLAACFSMLLVNVLLDTKGKTDESFISLDLMRLPLGVLSGMGFIGAGAIIRRDNMVLGITTAATLWFSTVMGLCFGSGQIGLGFAALGLGFGTLTGLKWAEQNCKQDRSAILTLGIGATTPSEQEMKNVFSVEGYRMKFISTIFGDNGTLREITCEIRWRGRLEDPELPAFLRQFAQRFALAKLEWRVVAGH